jgi:hypothetical protein
MDMRERLRIPAIFLACVAALVATTVIVHWTLRFVALWEAPHGHVMAAVTPIQGPPSPVSLSDGVTSSANLLGVASNPLVVTELGTTDGGGSIVVSGAVVQGDGGGQVNAWATDEVKGQLNSIVKVTAVATSQAVVSVDAGTFITANACNEGSATAWLQFYNMGALDAGSLVDAGNAPAILPLRLPPGSCGTLTEPNTTAFPGGITWYSSSNQGVLTVDAGISNMSVDVTYRNGAQ